MSLYVLTYDVRAKNPDYSRLYELLNSWGAAHLQDSVWLADMTGTPAAIRDAMKGAMHKDDTACVIQIFPNSNWATSCARETGNDWARSHLLK